MCAQSPAPIAPVFDPGDKQHLDRNGFWRYKVPSFYYQPGVEAELEKLGYCERLKLAALVSHARWD